MNSFSRILTALVVSIVAGLAPGHSARAQQPQKTFVNEELASESIRLEERLRKEGAAIAGARAPADFLREAAGLLQRNNARAALRPLAGAVAAAPRDATNWLAYSRAAFVAANGANDSYTLMETAATAAFTAYQRAATRNDEAGALAWLGEMYSRRANWRPALNAYRASLERADVAAVRAAYEPMREKYGFRALSEKIDSDSASPRACFPFSEPLARGKVDFAPFVAVAGSANAAIVNDEQQICVEGLKHGERYSIVLRQGLPSAVGENLLKSVDYQIYVKDRSPQVRFTGKNYVLPRVGQDGVPLISVNTPKVAVDILRVGDRNLLQTVRSPDFLAQIGASRAKKLVQETGQKIWSGTLDVRQELNKDVVTAFPVQEAVPKMEAGVYVMLARSGDKTVTANIPVEAPKKKNNDDDEESNGGGGDEESGVVTTQWFVVSDLGLTTFTGDDGVHVLVRSLASAAPMAGVELRLVARNNEILAARTTAADGHVKFDPGLSRGLGGMSPGLVVAGDDKGDYNFLDLTGAPFDLTDRGVKGRNAPKALEAFVYAERGVYRSGETVNVTTMLRDARGAAVSDMPLTLVAKRPDGVEYKRAVVADQGLGGRAWSIPLLSGVATGTWRMQAFVDPKAAAVGETSFLVEDYVPERVDVVVKPQQPNARQKQTVKVDLEARYLYGAPAAGLEVTGEVTIRPVESGVIAGFPGYEAGLADEEFENVKNEIEDPPSTDDKGKAVVEIAIPEVKAPRPVEAKVLLRVAEAGGRAVERAMVIPILPDAGMIAVKKTFGELAEGSLATFDVVTLSASGQRVARRNVQWSLYRVTNNYQWYNSDGRWGYERVKNARRVADGRVDVAAADPAKISATVGWGAWRLDLKSDEGGDAPTSVNFEVGWSGDATAETPDLLQVTLDKTSYRAGEQMKVRIASRFDGKASVAIVGDKVNDLRMLDVKTGDNVLTLPVSADWGSGAYAVALAHRPLDQAAKRMPGRALGLAWFGVDQDARKLEVSIEAPAKIEPRRALTIPVRLAGLAAGEEAYVTLAAVDIGILNLTRYEPPDPTKHFFGQRLLGAEVRDLYGLLIDGMQGSRGGIRSGGDGGAPMEGARPTQEPLSRYSGVVKVDAQGVARATFEIPAFNGAMRVMAVAWAKGRVGQASIDVVVRDPVIVQATLPRFLALGDQSRFHMQIDNVEGAAGDYTIDLDIRGPVTIPAGALRRVVRLNAGGRESFSVPVTGAGTGAATMDLVLSGPNVRAAQSFALNVQSGASALYRRSVRTVAAGGTVTISGDLLGDFVPGTGAVSVAVSPLGGIDVPALLQALDRYPYGCSEQIVSRAMPLLYVNKLASQELLPIDGKLDERVRDAIERVLTRQDTNGAIGLWTASGADDLWLHAFVVDFLTRARENKFDVPQRAFDQALDFMRNAVVNAGEFDAAKAEAVAYSVYVLARNGRPIMGDLRYLADTKLSNFASALARAQLGAALALLGDRGRAQAVFASANEQLGAMQRSRFSRADYGSRLRDSAGVLALASEAGMPRADLVKASLALEEERATPRYTSTQENAWMVLAAAGLSRETQNMALTVDGAAHQGAYYRSWKGLALEGRNVVVANNGQAPAQIVITTSGNPSVPEPAAENGYRIQRTFHRMDGKRVEPNAMKQNERYVVALKVAELEKAYARLLLVDQLPAGLEIENADMFEGGSIEDLAFLKRTIQPEHTEYRDDRFVAAINRSGGDQAEFTLAYIVRAVTPGKYVLPPATIEDMYAPQRFGRTAFGGVEIAEKP